MQPRFKHHCAGRCEFLGHEQGYDLYFCGGGQIATVIARYGSRDDAYTSGLSIARTMIKKGLKDPLVTALKLAQEKGLVA
jgi:hypothetical protein